VDPLEKLHFFKSHIKELLVLSTEMLPYANKILVTKGLWCRDHEGLMEKSFLRVS